MIQGNRSGEGPFAGYGHNSLRSFASEPVYAIKINWASVLFFSFFLAYGYYGAITPDLGHFKDNVASSITLLLLLTAILVCFGVLAWKAAAYQDTIHIRRGDLLVLFLLFAVLLSISYSQLQFSLYSDEISYSATSHGHSIRLSLLVAQWTNMLDDVPFQYVVQGISLVFLASLLGMYFLTRRLEWKSRIIIFAAVFVLGRLSFSAMGGNGSPHPPLQLLPPFIFGSLFGVTDITFKFSYFVVYTLFIFTLYRMLHRVFESISACLLALAIGTIPLLLHMGSVVEHSLWASICFTLVIAEIATSEKLNYVRLASFVSIMVLMRQPSFLAILPILILLFISSSRYEDRHQIATKPILVLSPVLLFVPFLGRSLIYGTPSTDAMESSASYLRAMDAVSSNIIWTSINNAVPYWWVALIPLAFIPLSRRTIGINLAFFTFFVGALYVYYSINPSLWGHAKYQAEYALPFACAGFIFLMARLTKSNIHRAVISAIAVVVVIFNILNFSIAPQNQRASNLSGGSKPYLSEYYLSGNNFLVAYPYDYRSAYKAIKAANLTENTYSIGPTYGVFPEIMNGFSVRSIKSAHAIYLKQQEKWAAPHTPFYHADSIERDQRIKAILIGAINERNQLIDELKNMGWIVLGDFKYPDYGTSVVALRK